MGTYIGQLKLNNGDIAPIGSTLFGTCTDASSVVAKTAIVPGFDKLIGGVTVHIHFNDTNTATNPTLSIKSSNSSTATTAMKIMGHGGVDIGTLPDTSWYSGSVLSLTHTGNYWYINDFGRNYSAVTAVKGNAETNYRADKVNLTPANIGALSINGGTMNIIEGVEKESIHINESTYNNITEIYNNRIKINYYNYNSFNSTYVADLSVGGYPTSFGNYSNASSNHISILGLGGYNTGADIRRTGNDNPKWAGISNYLNEALTQMWNTKGAWAYTTRLTSNLAVTTRTAVNSALNQTITAHGGVFFFYFFGVIQTSKNTTALKISVDGTLAAPITNTNSTTPMKVDGVYPVTLNAGTHAIKLEIVPQDSTTTGTVLAYNTIGWAAIEI